MASGRSATPGKPGRQALHGLVAAVALLGVLASVAVGATGLALGPPSLVVAFIAAMAFAGVLPFVIAVSGGEGEEVGADEALLVVMLVALPPFGVLLACLAGDVVVHAVRRRGALKVAYNHGARAIAVSVAIGLYSVLGDVAGAPRSAEGLAAAAVAVLAYSAVGAALIRMVVAVATQTPFRSAMRDGLGVNVAASALVIGWGLLVLGSTASDASAAALVAVPMAGSWLLRRSERQRESMTGLLHAAAAVGEAVRHGGVAFALAEAADRVLGRRGSRVVAVPPAPGQLVAEMTSRSGTRWLVAGARQSWDRPRRENQVLVSALAAIGEIAFQNASLLDETGRDPDTGLVTGALLQERLQMLLDHHRSAGAALVVVRIPRFEVVQRTLGPVAARRELSEVSARLRSLADEFSRPGEDVQGDPEREATRVVAGYLGGGDFALAVPGAASTTQALGVARVVQRELLRPVAVDGVELAIEPAIGVRTVAAAHDGIVPTGHLIRDAVSAAATAACRSGRRRIELLEGASALGDATVLAVEAELRSAVARKELTVVYQPVVSIATGRVVGAEALVRWLHPERGLIGPDQFVPIAEGSALIVDIDRYVLRQAIDQMTSWASSGIPEAFTVAVNLSAVHLAEPDTATFIGRLLEAAGLDGRRLTIEVTESSVMTEASSALATLEALADLGIDIALDDFGTGYSSLLYLRDFPIGKLKIDRSFVGRMTDSGGDAAIVTTIVRLAQTLGLSTVAEGVECSEQLAVLSALGCDAGQGFLWDRALEAEQFRARWLTSASPAAAGHPRPRGAEVGGGPKETGSVRDDELAYVVHELRSPLTAIDGFAYLAAEEVGRLEHVDQLSDYVLRIRHGVRTLQGVIDALADSSAANLGGMTLDLEQTEMNAFVEASVGALAPALGERLVRIRTSAPVHAMIDEARIGQVLRNLLTNAAKFSDPDAPIDISVSGVDGRCSIAVRDHGVGVPVERRGELFRRFARLGSSVKGMGLGLHLARTIARRHGGDVVYEPAPSGTGSTFTLHLSASPLNDADTVAELLPVAAPREAAGYT